MLTHSNEVKESALWPKPLRSQMKWITRQAIELSVRYAALSENSPHLILKCCHFEPEEGDITNRKWGLLATDIREIPTYCVVDVQEIDSQLELFVQGYAEFFLEQMATRPSKVPGIEPSILPDIVVSTFKVALKHQVIALCTLRVEIIMLIVSAGSQPNNQKCYPHLGRKPTVCCKADTTGRGKPWHDCH